MPCGRWVACENGRLNQAPCRLPEWHHGHKTASVLSHRSKLLQQGAPTRARMSRVVFPVDETGEMGPRQAGGEAIAAQGSTCADMPNAHAADGEEDGMP
jgi:hypothetical protein